MPLGQGHEPALGHRVAGQLRPQVGPALVGPAHVGHEEVEQPLPGAPASDHGRGRYDDALVEKRARVGRHRPGSRPADVGVVGARDRVAEQAIAGVDRRHQGEVGQMRSAGERVIEAHTSPRLGSFARTASTASGMAPRWTGMCAACATIWPLGVEDGGGAVAPLLDVGAERAADQRRAHLLGRATQGGGQDLAARWSRRSPATAAGRGSRRRRSAAPAGGDEAGGLAQVHPIGASDRAGARRSPAGRGRGRPCGGPDAPSRSRPGRRGRRTRSGARARRGTRSRRRRGRRRQARRARRPARAAAGRGPPRASRRDRAARAPASVASSRTVSRTACSPASTAWTSTARERSTRRSPRAAPRAERTPPAEGTSTRSISSSSATRQACIGPAPPKATRAWSRGSRPRSTVIRRTARTRPASATVRMPSAVASRSRPRRAASGSSTADRSLPVDADAAGQHVGQVAEDGMRVGDRGAVAAAPVAGRAGIRPALAGPTRSAPPGSRSAMDPPPAPTVARSSMGSRTGRPSIVPSTPRSIPAGAGHRHVAARAAHVEGDEVLRARAVSEQGRARRPGGRAGEDGPRRMRGHVRRPGEPAGGADDGRLGKALLDAALPKPRQVPRHDGAQVGVDRDGRGALVLAQLRHQLVRGRHRHLAAGAPHAAARPPAARAPGGDSREGARERRPRCRTRPGARPAPRRPPRPVTARGRRDRCVRRRRGSRRGPRAAPGSGRRGDTARAGSGGRGAGCARSRGW